MPTLDELLELELEGWEALSSNQGAAYYRDHLTEDALMAFPFGLLTRNEAIDAIESSTPWSSFELSDPRVVSLGNDSGVLAYSVVAQRSGQEPFSAVVSSTYVRREDGWKLAFHQQSPR